MGYLMQLRVGQRLGGAFTVLLALLLAVAALGLWELDRTNDRLQSVYQQRTVPLEQLGRVNAMAIRDRYLIAEALLLRNESATARALKELTDNADASEQLLQSYLSGALGPQERALVDQLMGARNAYAREGLAEARQALKDVDYNAVQNAFLGKVAEFAPPMAQHLGDLLALQTQLAQNEYEAAQKAKARSQWLVPLITLVALLLGAVLAWRITRSITVPTHEALVLAQSVASGDLSTRIVVTGHDEIAQLLAAFAEMNDKLAVLVRHVRESADAIATGSAEIANGNADLSHRTEQQAANLEETAASMEEMSATVRHNADTARKATELSASASRVAQRGGEVVGQVVSTMNDISASSKRIADIIGVIDGIAFQTNILALNAAVEAARAGEQGRGFAVVAGEVRTLAGRSAEAAKEIKSLIGASVDRVDAGTALVAEAGSTMGEIVAQVQRVASLINEMDHASSEQSQGIGQVSASVADLDRATQQNAALVEQAAAAAESLKQQAVVMREAVGVFKVPG
ncbi:MAG: methyl-accepting chemotaxis protein [Inhella sp.]|jgi:methyl-accepting chemotaxis protein-1 (serine sensor receptor)|uniref:methyl-accepting chemotaxis protein n=1 Tax=Inhella sp. TaxID=1921806 RepID=UPI0022BC2F71|nr:methyl-accepting chemotaxis protein [Inhella sp.]MCZ8235846.1 methyl-accepting chemotaxis protein [Inhella sp.]